MTISIKEDLLCAAGNRQAQPSAWRIISPGNAVNQAGVGKRERFRIRSLQEVKTDGGIKNQAMNWILWRMW